MGAQTNIEWATHTFNAWVGCTKVSPACDHCYAEGWAKRTGNADLWKGERRRTTAANWRQPIKWNEAARAAGERHRVFCASLADVFDNQVPEEWRADLWRLIRATPNLDWLLLTKRPQNIVKMLPSEAMQRVSAPWPWPNVWLGTTVENQAEADRRIPYLLAAPAAVRFLSCEPLLGPIDIAKWLKGCHECAHECGWRSGGPPTHERCNHCGAESAHFGEFCGECKHQDFSGICPECGAPVVRHHPDTPCIDWIICGGESGPNARPMHPDWARSLRDQCRDAGVAFFFKQWGEWLHETQTTGHILPYPTRNALYQWPDDTASVRVGKSRAGRLLDGIGHNAFPEV